MNKKSKFTIAPISREISRAVRAEMRSPQYGHPAYAELADGYGPCRECLRTFRQGKEIRILFTYDPFDGLSDIPSPGPVFIHKDACVPHKGRRLPAELLDLPLLFEGYGERSELLGRSDMDREKWETQVAGLLGDPRVKFVNIRNAEAGCFVARIERIEQACAA